MPLLSDPLALFPESAAPSDKSAAQGSPAAQEPPALQSPDYETKSGSAVDVVVDRRGRIARLSYLVPDEFGTLPAGTAVLVPFGKREVYGMVIGAAADPMSATREVVESYGKRLNPNEVPFVQRVATDNLTSLTALRDRLAPSDGKSSPPKDYSAPSLVGNEVYRPQMSSKLGQRRHYLLCGPLMDQTRIAAESAIAMASRNSQQVLILCPTVRHVDLVAKHFDSGIAKLDARSGAEGWKSFLEGTAQIGVGTKSAALYGAADLGGIILVEEDHPAHIEKKQPYTHARDVASLRATWFDAELYLLGCTPTAEALACRVKTVDVGASANWWPRVNVTDRNELPGEQRAMPPHVRAAAERRLRTGDDVYIAGKGAVRWRCAKCNTVRESQTKTREVLLSTKAPCPECGGHQVRLIGWDQLRVDKVLPGAKLTTVADAYKIAVRATKKPALVILPGLDGLLSLPGFRPEQRATSALIAACRVAGEDGEVIVISNDAKREPIASIAEHRTTLPFAKRTWRLYRELGLAPFVDRVTIAVASEEAPPPVDGHLEVGCTVVGPLRRGRDWVTTVTLPRASRVDLLPYVDELRKGRHPVRVKINP